MILNTTRENDELKIVMPHKQSVLSRALLWMGLGLAIIIVFAWGVLQSPQFSDFILRINNFYWLLLVINIVTVFAISFALMRPKTSLVLSAILYIVFVTMQAIFVSSTIIYSQIDFKMLILLMLIPAGVFILMGIIAHFSKINMTKLAPFLSFGAVALMILGLVLIFVNNQMLERWWLILAAIIFIGYIGFDIQMIIRADQHLLLDQVDNKTINKFALLMGFNLLLDFVNLFSILIRLWRNFN